MGTLYSCKKCNTHYEGKIGFARYVLHMLREHGIHVETK